MSETKGKTKSKNKATPVKPPQQQTDTPTKLDYAVANYLNKNLPPKQGIFVGIKKVDYFIGSKAVDALMESKFSEQFATREEVVLFLNDLLLKKFYHRAKKIVKFSGPKRKFKLDMHDVQVFEDSNEPYVWLYEPVSLKAWLYCIGLILLGLAACIFPLWPEIIRTCVYYACVASLILLSSFLGLSFFRYIIFAVVWALTLSKIHFWLLPNLTEDVGFFESFWPIYMVEARSDSTIGVTDSHED